jgi:toxin CcdB
LHEKNGIKAIARLIEGTHYVVMIPQLAGVPTKLLKKAAYSLEAKRSDIINALDLLFTGF